MVFFNCGPSEALVVSGFGYKKSRIIRGGSLIVWPFIQKVQRVDLSLIHITIESNAFDRNAIPITITCNACIKIGETKCLLMKFLQHFLSYSRDDLINSIKTTLECYQSSIIGSLTIEEIKKLANIHEKIAKIASKDLEKLGFTICSYVIIKCSDNVGYNETLLIKKMAEIKRDLSLIETTEKMNTFISIIKAEQDKLISINENMLKIEKMKYEHEKQLLCNKIALENQKAITDVAYKLEKIRMKKRILEELIKLESIEKDGEEKDFQEWMKCKKLNMRSTVELPCEAKNLELKTKAHSHSNISLMESSADAQAIIIKANTTVSNIRMKSIAELKVLEDKLKILNDLIISLGIRNKSESRKEFDTEEKKQKIISGTPIWG